MFDRLIHADWSLHPGKRWMAIAARANGSWQVERVARVGPLDAFLALLFSSQSGSTLAGFDFPIGLPRHFGERTGFANFGQALPAFGSGPWSEFYQVADHKSEIRTERPFYPRVSSAAARQAHLVAAHGATNIDTLRRRSELRTAERKAACPIFWTLGANQVGKAAIAGWQGVVQPSITRGAAVWPFDGTLEQLARHNPVVIAETYPAEAYGHVGVRFRPGQSKQRQSDRAAHSATILAWSQQHGLNIAASVIEELRDGFGPDKAGEDPFDAITGLLGMYAVASGLRAESGDDAQDGTWEGWILGMA